jgi:hypothetical protein
MLYCIDEIPEKPAFPIRHRYTPPASGWCSAYGSHTIVPRFLPLDLARASVLELSPMGTTFHENQSLGKLTGTVLVEGRMKSIVSHVSAFLYIWAFSRVPFLVCQEIGMIGSSPVE